MLVKCRQCGNKLEQKEAYKTTWQGKNVYFCCENHYKEWRDIESEKINRRAAQYEMTKVVYQIFGVEKLQNSILHNGLNQIAKEYSYEQITNYLNENFDYLHMVMTTKDFNSLFNQVKYFLAIVRNSMEDIKYKQPKPESVRHVEVEVIDSIKFKRKKKRRTLEEIESEVV